MISQPQSDAIRAIIARDAESNPRLAAVLQSSIRREPDERTSVTCLHHIPTEITGTSGPTPRVTLDTPRPGGRVPAGGVGGKTVLPLAVSPATKRGHIGSAPVPDAVTSPRPAASGRPGGNR